ncbi:MAG: hypothetical protein FJX72_07640 [Armatimonadetes bacterium]|nr:hypothetical protein [Armatimonadota bacterium]
MDAVAFDTSRWGVTDAEALALDAAGEHFAAGFLALSSSLHGAGLVGPPLATATVAPASRRQAVGPPLATTGSWAMRHACGIRRHLAHCTLRPYAGEARRPAGGSIWSPCRSILCDPAMPEPVIDLTPYYVSLDMCLNAGAARKRAAEAKSETERSAFGKLAAICEEVPRGGGWTHSIVHFERVLAEGLEVYEARVRRQSAEARDPDRRDLLEALLVVLDAFHVYRDRVVVRLREGDGRHEVTGSGARSGSQATSPGEAELNRRRLLEAYAAGIPFRAPTTFFEALVAVTFIYALDGSDDLGRFDQYMAPYYEDALVSGQLSREQAVGLIRSLWEYVDACSGWNVALGGSTRSGEPAYTDLTIACLEAGRSMRRPNLALRLRRDAPQVVWHAALDTLASGAGLPALYCEENYLAAIDAAHVGLSDEDKRDYAFGGCTELMVQGCSNVGSLDGDFSVIKVLETTLRHRLTDCSRFDDLLDAFESDLRQGISDLTTCVCRNQETRAACHPQLVRTLLIDECIVREREYYAGGARCNWSVINIVGLSNAVDSLAAIQRAVYDDRRVDAAGLLEALGADFAGHDDLLAYLTACPRFGNDDPRVDAIARRLSAFVYREFQRYAPWRGGKFICGTLMFVTYGWFGKPVGATPDGRRAATPVGDSAGPVQGRDRSGPTAMLRSVAALSQRDAPGTLVVNLRLLPELLCTPDGRERVQALVRGYFDLGGMQLQINVVDQATLEDAIAHPERHGDLIVRVGGYSEYFNRLGDDLKRTILERTAHG